MKKWLIISLLLLSSFDCIEGRDKDDKFLFSVGGKLDPSFRAQHGRGLGRNVFDKTQTPTAGVGLVVCSKSTRPDGMLLMFQLLQENSTTSPPADSDCSEVIRIRSHEKIHTILNSIPKVPHKPQIQLSFYNRHGNITPTTMDDYLTIDKGNRDLKPIFCSLTSYEAKGDKRDRSIKKTKATILCGLVHDETSHVAIGEAVRPSTYMIHYENKTIQEIIKLITFYQWGKSSSTYKISGLHIDALELRNQMTATFSFSTSLKAVRDLTIAVLVRSSFMQFGNISYDDDHLEVEPHFEGLAIDVFEAAVAVLPDRFNYKLVPFYGSCDQLVEEVASKTFHAGVGGILITAERSHVVEFSQPYAELGLVKVEKRKTNELNRVLWFMSPFTCEMWLTMAAITVFTGSVIWLIEHKTHCNNEVPSRQVEAVLCLFPFAFLLNEHRPKNILSYYVLVPWLVMTLIVTTTFTARLSSMVTSSQAESPDNIDINSLKRTAAAIASCGNSLTISSYLVKTLGFKLNNMRIFASVDNCAKALSNGNIKAAFLLTTDAKVFLAKYRRTFVKSGPAYNLGSFGFVFPRGSSLASEMSEAILKVKEAGEVQEMKEYKLPSNSDCSESDETVS